MYHDAVGVTDGCIGFQRGFHPVKGYDTVLTIVPDSIEDVRSK